MQSKTAFAYFEIDDNGEATGDVTWFCSEKCRDEFPMDLLTTTKYVPGTGNDYVGGSVCSACRKALDQQDAKL